MIPINKPLIDNLERDEILKVLDDGILTSASMLGGKRVIELEGMLSQYLDVRNVISVNSGTSALYCSLLSCGIGIGDEVILPSFTFVATANSVTASGAKPIFVDIEKETYTMDPRLLENKITNKTRAIIPVHLYGHPSSMDEIKEIATKNSLFVIEDACQSLGSLYKGIQTGTIGDVGCFSLYASKVLTSGEGGFIATNNDELSMKMRMVRNHGMVDGYDTRILGLNMRLPEINAAIAKIQMKKLPMMLNLRRRNSEKLTELLKNYDDIVIPKETEEKEFNWYLYTIAFRNAKRDEFRVKLNDMGIGATVYYDPPVHKTPYYSKNYPTLELENTTWSSKNVLSLPVHPSLTEKDLEYMSVKLTNLLE